MHTLHIAMIATYVVCCVLAMKRSNRGAKDTEVPKKQYSSSYNIHQYFISNRDATACIPYSAIQNDISAPGGSVETYKSSNKSTEEVPQRSQSNP